MVNRTSDFLEYIFLLEKQTIKKVNQKTKKEFQIAVRTKKTLKEQFVADDVWKQSHIHIFTHCFLYISLYIFKN